MDAGSAHPATAARTAVSQPGYRAHAALPHRRTVCRDQPGERGPDPARSARSDMPRARCWQDSAPRNCSASARWRPICSRKSALPLGDAVAIARDYVAPVSATTGLPHVMARRNMQKIRTMLAEMETVVNGLTRRLDLGVLDRGGHAEGLSYFPRGESLGVVLPSNSPGVHSLWAAGLRAENAAGAEAGSGRAVDALPHHPGADPGGRAAGCLRLLSGRSRGRGRDSAALRARHGVRRRIFDAAVAGRSAHRGAWARLQQDRDRRRLYRGLGAIPGRDGLFDPGKLRPVVHQCVGRMGAVACSGDC